MPANLFAFAHKESDEAFEQTFKEGEVEAKDVHRDGDSQEGAEGGDDRARRNMVCIKIECNKTYGHSEGGVSQS